MAQTTCFFVAADTLIEGVSGGGKKKRKTKEKRKGEGKEEKIRIKTLLLASGERGGAGLWGPRKILTCKR